MLQPTLSAEQRNELHRLLEEIASKMPTWIEAGADLKNEINDLLLGYDVEITDIQINLIVQSNKDALALEEELVKTYGQKLNPKLKVMLQMAASLGAIYYMPGMFANTAFNAVAKDMLPTLAGAYSGPALGAINILLQSWLTQYAPQNVMNAILPRLVETYGPAAYLIAPAGVLGYQLVTNTTMQDLKELQHCATDFVDLMHGDLSEEEFARIRREHPNAWATKTIDEVASDLYGMVSWLWKRKPATPTSSSDEQLKESRKFKK